MSTTVTSHTQVNEHSPNGKSTTLPTLHIRPHVDILEHADHYKMLLDLPGVSKEKLDVTLDKNMLSIVGVAEFVVPEGYQPIDGRNAHRSYERSFRLSDEIDREHIEVELTNGVLSLRLPKSQQAQKVKLAVK